MDNFLVRYASRVVIYYCRAVIRLATGSFASGLFCPALVEKNYARFIFVSDFHVFIIPNS